MSQVLVLVPIIALSLADDTKQFVALQGEKYKVIDGVICATDQKYVEELRTAIQAKDEDGANEMIARGHVRIIEDGTVLVLKVHDRTLFGDKEVLECRYTQNGKNKGKVFIFLLTFTSKNFEKIEK